MRRISLIALALVLTASSGPAHAYPGDPDTSFNSGRAQTLDFKLFDFPEAVVVQKDHKVVVAGTASGASGTTFAIGRLTKGGAKDGSFSKDGRATVAIGPGAAASGLAYAANGDLFVAGQTWVHVAEDVYDTNLAVARLTKSGALRGSFGDGGTVVVPIPSGAISAERGISVIAQKDGKVVIGATVDAWLYPPDPAEVYVERNEIVVVRLDTAGQLDPTFGTGGIAMIAPHVGSLSLSSLLAGPGGSIIATATSDAPAIGGLVAMKLMADGALDPTFGAAGTARATFAQGLARMVGAGLDSKGRLVLVGYVPELGGMAFARFDAAGQLDATFAGDGTKYQVDTDNISPAAATVHSTGKIVVAGRAIACFGSFCGSAPAVRRYKPSGAIDKGFGIGGTARLDSAFSSPTAVTLDGVKPVAAGYAWFDFRSFDVDFIVQRLKG